MARTIVGVGDPMAAKRWSAMLFVDKARSGWWSTRMMSKGETAEVPVQILTDLEKQAGDTIHFDLFMQLKGKPTYGDQRLKGKAEALSRFGDNVSIDQVRHAVDAGGKMSRKRTLHDLRTIAKKAESEWRARFDDEICHMYNAGARGVNSDFIEDTNYTGFAGNTFQAPDATHQMYGGSATSKASLTNTDKMSLALIDRFVAKAGTLGGGTTGIPELRPINIDAGAHFVCLMGEYDAFNLRTSTSTGQWLDIQKAAAAAQGSKNPIFMGGLGMYNDVVLQKHKAVIRFNDYGAGSNLAASRVSFLGVQALVMAYGDAGGGNRFDWMEDTDDYGNEVSFATAAIYGAKATVFNSMRYGAVYADVYSADPG